MIHAFVLIRVEPTHITEVARRTAEFDAVRSAHSVTGGEADVVAFLEVAAHDDIARVVTEELVTLPGIISTRTMIGFRTYSSDDLDAAYEGFGD